MLDLHPDTLSTLKVSELICMSETLLLDGNASTWKVFLMQLYFICLDMYFYSETIYINVDIMYQYFMLIMYSMSFSICLSTGSK